MRTTTNPTSHQETQMPNFDNPAHRTTKQQNDRATPFRTDDRMETFLRMREDQPTQFAGLTPSVHIAVGLYESDKATNDRINGSDA